MDMPDMMEAAVLAAHISSRRIDTMFMTTAWFNALVEQFPDTFSNVKYLLAGGERASCYHFNLLSQKYPGIELRNIYGPTENTTFSCSQLINRRFDYTVPIGKAIRGSRIYVLSKMGKPVFHGIVGDILTTQN